MYDEKYINEKSLVPVEILDEIDSTNEEAKRRIRSGKNEDFVLVARKQTAGKGRKGRSFYSPMDTGIYFTFVHFSDSSVSDNLKVTVATSVIASKAIKEVLGIDCMIKWVNDLYLNDKKVSGTLCECILKGTYENDKDAVIIGTGINISTKDFPDDLLMKAGSLSEDPIGTSDNIRNDLVVYLTNGLNDFFTDPDLSGYLGFYNEHSLILGKSVELSDASGLLDKGTVKGFDEKGAIIIENEAKDLKVYDSGEISLFML